jgi:hypothetical protein
MPTPLQRLQRLTTGIATRIEFGWDDDNAAKIATASGVLGAASSYVRGGVENSANWSNKRRLAGALAGGLITGAGGYAVTKLLKNTKGNNGHWPVSKFAALADVIELGMRAIRSGPMAGQIARWGRHLPANLPHGTMGTGKGIYQIHDPATKATMTIERSRKAYSEGAENWVGGKHAYIANIHLPKKNRATMAGGKSLGKMTKGVFDHFDKRGIHASTLAGAYERQTISARAADTHGLVQSYQKRGFKIDSSGPLPNDWNVPMRRRPNAPKGNPVSAGRFEGHMARLRRGSIDRSATAIKEHTRPLAAPAATLAGAGAAVGGTAYAAHREGPQQEPARRALVPGMIAGAAVAGGAAGRIVGQIRATGRDTVDHAIAVAQAARVHAGKVMARRAGRGAQLIGRQLLTGVV